MHEMVTLTADVMFVSGIPFLVTFSRNINFRTAECVPRRTAELLAKSIKKVISLYARGGFIVNLALMHKEFDKGQEHIPFLQINTTAAREHVGEIEREIRQIKERTHCTTSDFPFEHIPTMVLIYAVYNVCLWLNAFPIRSGVKGGFHQGN